MAITQSVVDMVVDRTAGRRVASVQLQVGKLAGVVADAMRFCFELATSGTVPMTTSEWLDRLAPKATAIVELDEQHLSPGDWVLIHMGFAVERVDAAGAEEAMAGLELMGRPRDEAPS